MTGVLFIMFIISYMIIDDSIAWNYKNFVQTGSIE